jgi:hypothetical protein
MRRTIVLLTALTGLAIAGCGATDDREWMKVGAQYTKADFQRDHRECLKKGDLDEACMRQRGWVAVNPSKSEPQKPTDPLGRPRGGRY